MKIVSVSEMIQLEKNANNLGISYEAMMKNAGTGIASWLYRHYDIRRGVVGLIGAGNNGGDTLIALTWLSSHNIRTFAFLVKQRAGDPLLTLYQETGGVVIDLSENKNLQFLKSVLIQNPLILDGMLGTGFRLPLRGPLAVVMGNIKKTIEGQLSGPIIAVDCPSGIDCDTGEVSNETLRAEATLTMAAVKQGLVKFPARGYTGEINLIEIGIPVNETTSGQILPEMICPEFAQSLLPVRSQTGHKGTFGTCLVMAGSEAYTGAAFLAGKAAYRAGCGLVNLATSGSVRDALAGVLIESVWTVLPDSKCAYDPKGIDLVEPALKKADSLIIGPGWGINTGNAEYLKGLLDVIQGKMPTIFDADSLKLLTQIKDWWTQIPESTVLTPHPGEMSVLTGLTISEIESNRWEIARHFAQEWGVTLVLKGALTVIGTPEGPFFINPISDSALATAGSGDVLSGVIGGLMAQGVAVSEAAVLGTWTHGIAGLLAKQAVGSAAGVTALDIMDQIGESIR